jgi:hypothetical protein
MQGGALSKKYKNEIHGSQKAISGIYNFSFDGLACEDANIEKFKAIHAKTEIFFFWSPRFNGRWESNDTTPRPERKGWPDPKHIRSIVTLGSAKRKTKLAKGWLWKSHSENKGNGDPRAEKPVLICPIKEHHATLKVGKKVLTTLGFYGQYTDGRYRYYATEWGFEILKKAKGRLIDITLGKKWGGTVNPAFRENEWRDK